MKRWNGKRWNGLLVAVAMFVGVSAQAQMYRIESGTVQREFNYKVAGDGQNTFFFEANMESPMVTGAPYTAKAVTTMTQTLADGNRIKHNSEVELARDSEGRTRREQSVANIGPWQTNAKGTVVVINDPVTHTRYEIGPDGNKSIARKISIERRPLLDKAKAEAEMQRHEGRGVGVGVGVGVGTEPGMGSNVVIVASGEDNVVRTKIDAEGTANKNVKTEDLGQQTIEGVTATGTRKTITIPAGQIGNEQPIQIVSENWYSPELKMTVWSKRDDPRIGETEFKLTNIQRGEPAASLFQVPAGVEVRDMDQIKHERDF